MNIAARSKSKNLVMGTYTLMWVPIVLGKRETTKQVHLLGLEITNFIMFFQSVHQHNF
jgi:hypothetical protein